MLLVRYSDTMMLNPEGPATPATGNTVLADSSRNSQTSGSDKDFIEWLVEMADDAHVKFGLEYRLIVISVFKLRKGSWRRRIRVPKLMM
jgi:hypothetical protein